MLGFSWVLKWLLGLLGLAENRALFPISDYSSNNTRPWLLLFIFLAIVLLRLGLLHLAETRASNSTYNGNEVDQSLALQEDQEELTSDPMGQSSEGFEQPAGDRTDANSAGGGRRHGVCAFCGNLSTTRCSRCKAARYCSVECQIKHWRSVHKYECTETETVDQERHAHGAPRMVEKPKKDGSNGSNVVEWNSKVKEIDGIYHARRQTTNASSEARSNCYSCAVCGGPATTRCSRCKTVRYCSAKCLIEDWRCHKLQCIAKEVDSTHTDRPPLGNAGSLKNSYEEEDNDHLPGPLSLEYYPEGTTNVKPLVTSSQEPTKKARDHTVEGVRCLEEEIAQSRNEIIFLQSQRDKWAMRANFAKETYHSFKKESERQLLALKNEKELISKAEEQARNKVHSLSEKLQNSQMVVQASNVEKRKQEEYVQMLESKCAELKRELLEEWQHIQELTADRDKNRKTAQIAMTEVEEKEKELQLERERVQLLKEDFLRDVTAAESRAVIAEAKLWDLDRKIRLKNDKVAVWTDSLGRPAMACVICLTNEKDLAFGCGHMTCRDCGSKISKCPICREQITSLVRLFPG